MTRATETAHFRPVLSRPSKIVILLGVLAFLAVFTSSFRQSASLIMEAQPRRAVSEGYLVPSVSALRLAGLGHDEMMADLVWLKALSYFANHFYLDRDYRWLDRYIETMAELDPDFRMVYQWAGVVTMYGGQRIDNQAVQSSIRFLEMGWERFPRDWMLSFMLGVNYRYELIPANDEEARRWRIMGAAYLGRAAELPGAPAWLTLNASKNLEAYGAEQNAINLERQTFLTRSGVLSATLAAEMQLHEHYPSYSSQNVQGIGVLVSSGLALQEKLSPIDWAELLVYRRLTFADLDSASGYLYPELLYLTRGEPFLRRLDVETTPLDRVFLPSIDGLMEPHDLE